MPNRDDDDDDNNNNDNDRSGVAHATASHTYLAKDGYFYTSYEYMAKANKALVEKRMQDLGLDKYCSSSSSSSRQAQTTTPPSPQQSQKTKKKARQAALSSSLEPQRRSKRVRKEPAPSSFAQESSSSSSLSSQSIKIPRKKMAPKRNHAVLTADDTNLLASAADRERLGHMYSSNDNNNNNDNNASWMDDMEHYLKHTEHLSEQNYRSVMRQVRKLHSGDGITYHHWPANTCFAKGQGIDLTWNMQTLYEQACEAENEYGRDLGNGWLLRHPIKKLHNFQVYLLNEKKTTTTT